MVKAGTEARGVILRNGEDLAIGARRRRLMAGSGSGRWWPPARGGGIWPRGWGLARGWPLLTWQAGWLPGARSLHLGWIR